MFKDKVVLITGAAAGIGLAAAEAFAAAGGMVVLADRDKDAAVAAGDIIRQGGGEYMTAECDVADSAAVQALLAKIAARFGRLDIAYNNAGIQGEYAATAEADERAFQQTLALNLGGIFNCMKYELRQMLHQADGGCIINCSSQSGLVGSAGTGAYTAAKHGVIGLTKCAALEYIRHGIRINAICPGAVNTALLARSAGSVPAQSDLLLRNIPAGRLAEPEEIAKLILWLASPDSSFIVGQAVVADGGYTIH